MFPNPAMAWRLVDGQTLSAQRTASKTLRYDEQFFCSLYYVSDVTLKFPIIFISCDVYESKLISIFIR